MKRLTNLEEVEDARSHLAELLETRGEWFLRQGSTTVPLRGGEWELRVASGALTFSYRGVSGALTWRVAAWARDGEGAQLDCTRRMGAERARLELAPCALVASARDAVAAARRRECERIATLACKLACAKLERAALSAGARRGEPGRWARILLRRGRERIAVAAPVVPSGAEGAESFLASTLLWLARLEAGAARAKPNALWLVAPQALCAAVCERLALLRDDLRALISLFEVDEAHAELAGVRVPGLAKLLLAQSAPRLFRPAPSLASDIVASVIALASDAIDVVRARRGETLRFNGLPFVRVRRVLNEEHVWFGIERTSRRRLLDGEGAEDLLKLVAELKEHRRADATDHRHALYRAAPEAWLESLLRRDITRLDPGLKLAPLHAQFRASRVAGGATRPVDLLALRHDGRLVVIELKVSEDVSLALQGADYWRRVEAHRLCGNIERARLFGEAKISEEPPLVYLVAPLLRFHRSFSLLARAITPEIEMYRLDVNENWRESVRVVRRSRANQRAD